MSSYTPAPGTVTMFSTEWCGHCNRLKGQLTRAGIEYREVNIETEPEAAAEVETVNDGNRTVPILIFPDGSAATNPSLAEVAQRLG